MNIEIQKTAYRIQDVKSGKAFYSGFSLLFSGFYVFHSDSCLLTPDFYFLIIN
jgi:hypothetical protein